MNETNEPENINNSPPEEVSKGDIGVLYVLRIICAIPIIYSPLLSFVGLMMAGSYGATDSHQLLGRLMGSYPLAYLLFFLASWSNSKIGRIRMATKIMYFNFGYVCLLAIWFFNTVGI